MKGWFNDSTVSWIISAEFAPFSTRLRQGECFFLVENLRFYVEIERCVSEPENSENAPQCRRVVEGKFCKWSSSERYHFSPPHTGGTFPRRCFFFDFFAALLAANFPTPTHNWWEKHLRETAPQINTQHTHSLWGVFCCRFSARFSPLAVMLLGKWWKTMTIRILNELTIS